MAQRIIIMAVINKAWQSEQDPKAEQFYMTLKGFILQ